uniref:Uncharacterized protein n=1 Tax=Oryza rufipogon TaxID=4529 RepID=A0A0E0PIH1_ORYRU
MEMSLVWRGGNCLDFWDRCLFLEEERRRAPAADGCLAKAASTREGRQWGEEARDGRLPRPAAAWQRSSGRRASEKAAGSRLAEAAAAHLDGGSGRALPMQRRRLLLELILIQEAVMKGSRDGLGGGTTMECGW